MTDVGLIYSRRHGLTARMMNEFNANPEAKLLVKDEKEKAKLIHQYLIPESEQHRIISCQMILKGEVSL